MAQHHTRGDISAPYGEGCRKRSGKYKRVSSAPERASAGKRRGVAWREQQHDGR